MTLQNLSTWHYERAYSKGFYAPHAMPLPNGTYNWGFKVTQRRLMALARCTCGQVVTAHIQKPCTTCTHKSRYPRYIFKVPMKEYFKGMNPADYEVLKLNLTNSTCTDYLGHGRIHIWGEGPWAKILKLEKPLSYNALPHYHIDFAPAEPALKTVLEQQPSLTDWDIAVDIRTAMLRQQRSVTAEMLDSFLMAKTIPESYASIQYLKENYPKDVKPYELTKILKERYKIDESIPLGKALKYCPIQLQQQISFCTPGALPPLLTQTWKEPSAATGFEKEKPWS